MLSRMGSLYGDTNCFALCSKLVYICCKAGNVTTDCVCSQHQMTFWTATINTFSALLLGYSKSYPSFQLAFQKPAFMEILQDSARFKPIFTKYVIAPFSFGGIPDYYLALYLYIKSHVNFLSLWMFLLWIIKDNYYHHHHINHSTDI